MYIIIDNSNCQLHVLVNPAVMHPHDDHMPSPPWTDHKAEASVSGAFGAV